MFIQLLPANPCFHSVSWTLIKEIIDVMSAIWIDWYHIRRYEPKNHSLPTSKWSSRSTASAKCCGLLTNRGAFLTATNDKLTGELVRHNISRLSGVSMGPSWLLGDLTLHDSRLFWRKRMRHHTSSHIFTHPSQGFKVIPPTVMMHIWCVGQLQKHNYIILYTCIAIKQADTNGFCWDTKRETVQESGSSEPRLTIVIIAYLNVTRGCWRREFKGSSMGVSVKKYDIYK